MRSPLAVTRSAGVVISPPRAAAAPATVMPLSAADSGLDGAMAKRVGLGLSGSSSSGATTAARAAEALVLAAGALSTAVVALRSLGGAATTLVGLTSWLTKAVSRQAMQTVTLIRMSRMAA